jgi:hypothetical protein
MSAAHDEHSRVRRAGAYLSVAAPAIIADSAAALREQQAGRAQSGAGTPGRAAGTRSIPFRQDSDFLLPDTEYPFPEADAVAVLLPGRDPRRIRAVLPRA